MKLKTLFTVTPIAIVTIIVMGCKPSADSGMGGTDNDAPAGITTNSVSSPVEQIPAQPMTSTNQLLEQNTPREVTPPPQQ
jgi:hypothetical protein